MVPFFFKGAGSEDIKAAVKGTDPVRGDFIDNTDIAKLVFNNWWTEDDSEKDDDKQDEQLKQDGSSKDSVGAGLAGAGIMAAILAAVAAALQAIGMLKIDMSTIQKFLK